MGNNWTFCGDFSVVSGLGLLLKSLLVKTMCWEGLKQLLQFVSGALCLVLFDVMPEPDTI